MTKIVLVYQSGGEFTIGHVRRLVDQLRGKDGGAPIVCLTDQPDEVEYLGIEAHQLMRRYPPYCWCKMEVHRIEGPALYLDLDVNVVGSLKPLLEEARNHHLVTNRDFWGMNPPGFNACVMGWRKWSRASMLYEEFAEDVEGHVAKYQTGHAKGRTQAFIADRWDIGSIPKWQTLLPGSVLSFKNEVRRGADMSRCRIIASHGTPRPWEKGGADAWLRQ